MAHADETDGDAIPEPGSILEIVTRLALWALRAPRGLARIESGSGEATREAIRTFHRRMTLEGVSVVEIELPRDEPPIEVVRFLIDRLRSAPAGVASVSGFASALPIGPGIRDALRPLNANRENLAVPHLRQVWWMVPAFVEEFFRAAPDLESWFSVRLLLTEELAPPETIATAADFSPSRPPLDLREARRQADRLTRRFETGMDAGGRVADLIGLASDAVGSLELAGLHHEALGLAERLLSRPPLDDPVTFRDAIERELGPDQIRVADCYHMFAQLQWVMGRMSVAEPFLRSALERRERALGPEHPDTVQNFNELAYVLNFQGQSDEAIAMLRRVVEFTERSFGPNHYVTVICLQNLAVLLNEHGRLDEAERLIRRVLDLRQRTLGPGHPDTAESLHNLAVSLSNRGRLDEAEPLLRRNLEDCERVLGPDHPETAKSLDDLGVLLARRGVFEEAEVLVQRALDLRASKLGPDHRSTADSLNALGWILLKQGRLDEAEPLFRRALAVREHASGPDHPETERIRKNLAALPRDAERVDPPVSLQQHASGRTQRDPASGPSLKE